MVFVVFIKILITETIYMSGKEKFSFNRIIFIENKE